MELGLAGRVALITGGSRGIGRACALGLAAEGCRVMLSARDADGLARVVREAEAKGAEAASAAADLTRLEDVERVVQATLERFGRIDILVNNAGAIRGGDFLTLPDRAWAEDWELKPLGYVRMARAVLPHMRERRWGRIINIVGAAARNPSPAYTIGGTANAGLINFTKALADLGARDNILVTAVSPGATATERQEELIRRRAQAAGRPVEELRREIAAAQPLGRLARPEEIADLVVFLASERASFISGVAITIDGGASRGVFL